MLYSAVLISAVPRCESAVRVRISPSQVSLVAVSCLLPFSHFPVPQPSGLLSAKVEAFLSPLTSKVSPDLPFTWCVCAK